MNISDISINWVNLIFAFLGFIFGIVAGRTNKIRGWILSPFFLIVAIMILVSQMGQGLRILDPEFHINKWNTHYIFALFGYVLGFLYARMVNHEPRKIERGASVHCSVCGMLQKSSRLRKCSDCGKLFCNFPQWNDTSIRMIFERLGLLIAIPIFIILTAVSILGGIATIAFLALPYLLIRELLPYKKQPVYWKNCGDEKCNSCRYLHTSLRDKSYNFSNYSHALQSDYTENDSDIDERYSPFDEKDADEDRNLREPDLFDGTLAKYGRQSNNDDEE